MLPHQTSLTKYLFGLFLIVVLVYAYFAARNMLYGPQIHIDAPAEGITVHSSLIQITGTVENVAVLKLEGTIIPVDEQGTFTDTLAVAPGINTLVLTAEDTFGRTHEQTLTILYTPEPKEPQHVDAEPLESNAASPVLSPDSPTQDLVE